MDGTLRIITGPMKSGKTTEALRLMCIEAKTGFSVIYVNSSVDTRADGEFSTHNPLYKEKLEEMDNVSFYTADSLPKYSLFLNKTSIYFDEVQFWKEDTETIVNYIMTLVEEMGKNVTVSGLTTNHYRQIWGPISTLMSLADECKICTGLCDLCAVKGIKRKSIFSLKIAGDLTEEVSPGFEQYASVCRKCYLKKK